MNDSISRQAAIDAVNKYFKMIRLNPEILVDSLITLPSAQPERIQNNAVHLCDSCQYTYVTCPSHGNDAVFGDGKGNDNICACNKYRPISAQPVDKDTNVPCTDTISRQAAIDAVGSMLRRKFGVGGDLAEITIAELPPAQPETRCVAEVKIDGEELQECVDKAVRQIAENMPEQRWIPFKKPTDFPAIEPERKKGEWIGTEFDGYADGNPVYYEWKCSSCGCIVEDEEPTWNFCPNCGADMREEYNDET